jgi:hypothetical protein
MKNGPLSDKTHLVQDPPETHPYHHQANFELFFKIYSII